MNLNILLFCLAHKNFEFKIILWRVFIAFKLGLGWHFVVFPVFKLDLKV